MEHAVEQEWSPFSWRNRPGDQLVAYDDPAELEACVERLASLPPLVTSWEVERLKGLLADAQRGERFLLHGGDCAERFADCTSDVITSKLKILLQMSLVLVYASKRPVIRLGRFAGQYAKPRSSATETRVVDGAEVTLPSYFGDLVNRAEFDAGARRADPRLLLAGYHHAGITLNFIRSLLEAGFGDLHHPEYWDLSFLRRAALTAELRREYEETIAALSDGLRFMEAIGERRVDEFTRVDFYSSHEGLNLWYEAAQTRRVPRREGYYNLTTHLPWIGERTRAVGGAHVEYFRGVRNPVGVKVGPGIGPELLLRLIDMLNPDNEWGKVVLIARMGAKRVQDALPPLVETTVRGGKRVLWVCDPMHGNTVSVSVGGAGGKEGGSVKTRVFEDILRELDMSWTIHEQMGSRLGGVHVELTGEDVTECVGGSGGLRAEDLSRKYHSPCDPRLNYEQSMELAFLVARRMAASNGRAGK